MNKRDIAPDILNMKNLEAIANLMLTIPQERFNMGITRKDDWSTIDYKGIGNPIGLSIVLDDPKNVCYLKQSFTDWIRGKPKEIDFFTWFTNFTGMTYGWIEWNWCFSDDWVTYDNTPTGAAKRIMYLVEGNTIPFSVNFCGLLDNLKFLK